MILKLTNCIFIMLFIILFIFMINRVINKEPFKDCPIYDGKSLGTRRNKCSCSPGYYRKKNWRQYCVKCEAGTYSTGFKKGNGGTSCKKCPRGHVPNEGRTECILSGPKGWSNKRLERVFREIKKAMFGGDNGSYALRGRRTPSELYHESQINWINKVYSGQDSDIKEYLKWSEFELPEHWPSLKWIIQMEIRVYELLGTDILLDPWIGITYNGKEQNVEEYLTWRNGYPPPPPFNWEECRPAFDRCSGGPLRPPHGGNKWELTDEQLSERAVADGRDDVWGGPYFHPPGTKGVAKGRWREWKRGSGKRSNDDEYRMWQSWR